MHVLKPEVDVDAYLADSGDWMEDWASETALATGVVLTPEHWDVLRYMRAYYEEHRVPADAGFVMRHLSETRGAARNRLFELFRYGYPRSGLQDRGHAPTAGLEHRLIGPMGASRELCYTVPFRRGAMALSAHDWDIVMRTPLLKAMGPTISRAMIGDRGPKAYARGERIFDQGDPADGFFCIIEGWAKLYRLREDGEEVVVAIFSACETFAEVAMFLGGRYPASCETVSSARILKIDAAKLRRAVMEQPQLAFDMLAAASMRLRQLVDEIEHLKARSAPRRIADFFVKQATETSGPARIALPYEKALIASRLGMKPESFSRALGKLADLGVVVERESVSIADVARLAAFAEGQVS